MSTLFDRLNRELEDFGRRAQEVFDDGRVRLELMRLRNQRDAAARELGYLMHRRERGGEVEQGRVDAALFKLDDFDREIARLEQQLVDEGHAPAPADVHADGDAQATDGEPTVATPS